jgi:hypothetical protein
MTVLVMLLLAGISFGQTTSTPDVATAVKKAAHFVYRPQKKHKFTRGAVLSSGECVAGIALSSNPVGAAAVGLPVLFVGNVGGVPLTGQSL